jgi:hypothetical protein
MTIETMVGVLSGVPAGAIPASMRNELFKLVAASWHEFAGSDETSMGAWKILRDEGPWDVSWIPPCLSFTIERHGGTVLGSSRAEKQRWTLNLEKRTADHVQTGFRQLRPNAPKLDVKSLADEVCNAVQEGPSSPSRFISDRIVVWKNDDEVIVFHGKIVGGAYQRTVSGRRRRFRADLETKMAVIGWEFVSAGRGLTFRKTK